MSSSTVQARLKPGKPCAAGDHAGPRAFVRVHYRGRNDRMMRSVLVPAASAPAFRQFLDARLSRGSAA